mgnify:CR=1 FL=1
MSEVRLDASDLTFRMEQLLGSGWGHELGKQIGEGIAEGLRKAPSLDTIIQDLAAIVGEGLSREVAEGEAYACQKYKQAIHEKFCQEMAEEDLRRSLKAGSDF